MRSSSSEQVRIDSYFSTEPSKRVRTNSSSECGTTGSSSTNNIHESLRKFAEGYHCFGINSTIGATNKQQQQQPQLQQLHQRNSSGNDELITANSILNETENFATRANNCNNSSEIQQQLKNSANNTNKNNSGKKNKNKNKNKNNSNSNSNNNNSNNNSNNNNNNSADCEKISNSNSSNNNNMNSNNGSCRKQRRHLLFGDHAPRTTVASLHVRERIERKGIPKRQRVGVDALTEMMERVLTDADETKLEEEKRTETETESVCGQRHCQQQRPSGQPRHPRSDQRIERSESPVTTHQEDDDTADELSFLVKRCDLEPESKQSHFMPYIT